MLTPDQFFGKYDQRFVDFDGNAKYWCVDLYRQFVKECFNFPQSPIVAGAKDIWTTYLTEYFNRIENSPTNCPIKGDIIIWGSGLSADGHVAICKDGDSNQFTSQDQNWPVGSPCHFVPHNYNNVLGWLRVKTVADATPTLPPPSPTYPDLSSELQECNTRLGGIEIDLSNQKATILGAKNILYGKGFVWIKLAKLKVLIPLND